MNNSKVNSNLPEHCIVRKFIPKIIPIYGFVFDASKPWPEFIKKWGESEKRRTKLQEDSIGYIENSVAGKGKKCVFNGDLILFARGSGNPFPACKEDFLERYNPVEGL